MFQHLLSLIVVMIAFAAPSYAQTPPLSPEDFHASDPAKAKIGQLLFYDKILSGNQNISCGTCHHHDFGSADGLSLGIGEGGMGLGRKRTAGQGDERIRKRIPRNAPGLWNIGHKDIKNLFHDGRLEISDLYQNGFNSPAEEWLPQGLDTVVAAQAVFPMVAQFEMAGNPKENEIAGAIHDRIDAAWPILAKRVRVIPEYGQMFVDAFDTIDTPDQVTIVEVAIALGDFINSEWQSTETHYDDVQRGLAQFTLAQQRGADLFFGRANCASCHSGPLFTDQGFHALGLPAFGPGRTRRFDPMPRDVGRMGESDALEDAYRFRTPSLRNVTLTAPYGHNGAYATLEGIIKHHANPQAMRAAWDKSQVILPDVPWLSEIDFVIQTDKREMARQAAALDITPVDLGPQDIQDIIAFLATLEDKQANKRPLGRPLAVPSGLPVD